MSEFRIFKDAVAKQFEFMKGFQLFKVDVTRDEIWNAYIKSFPAGTNPIRTERAEYDCNYCNSFVRNAGPVVAISNGKLVSLWDIDIEDETFKTVAEAMSKFVKSKPIQNFFFHEERTVGVDKNFSDKNKGPVVTWHHFFLRLPNEVVLPNDRIGPTTSDFRSSFDVMKRGLKELNPEAVETVLDLINQNSLYRGEEQKPMVLAFQKLQTQFRKLKTEQEQDIFCWSKLKEIGPAAARVRNTAVGTLLVDLTNDEGLDKAVASFEAKVAPTNYKRPTALVTKGMIQKAQKTIEELGLAPALERRYATVEDITVNNILFAERSTRSKLKGNVFDDMAANVKENPKTFEKVEEVGIEDFIKNVMPKAESIEVMLENRHMPNLVSLVAPVDPSAKHLFKWQNNFSWSYTGEVTDSIKERVKKAGGKVDGDLRCSLSWSNFDDLDFHMKEPGGNTIYFRNKVSTSTKGNLDVDMNAGSGQTRSPVENITYPDRKYMREGLYGLFVHNFARRETTNVGFEVEIEFDGKITTIAYAKAVPDQALIEVAQIQYTKTNGFQIVKSLPSTETSKEIWGIPSQKFHKASVVMLSPNYWDEKAVGNKHYFFMLEGCKNEGKARGFFNEFLAPELDAHRKVLEIVGSKMKTDESDHQLSGLGFSSTQRNHLICKVKGNFTRNVKVLF